MIRLWRFDFTDEYNVHRMIPKTNVPHHITVHSPDGFEWGYIGSGPSDLALNILHALVPPGTDGEVPMDFACNLPGRPPIRQTIKIAPTVLSNYFRFRDEILANIPREGGEINEQDVYAWLKVQKAKDKAAPSATA